MNLNKPKKKMNKSVEINKPRNINVKGALKWPANLNWDQNNEVLFKTHIKDKTRNKTMTAYDRNHIDSVRNLIEGNDDEKDDETNKDKKSGTKKKTMYKRPSFDKKGLGLSRAQKLKNNYSILEDPKEYQNNVRLNNVGNKYEVKEYNVLKSGNIDIFEFVIKDVTNKAKYFLNIIKFKQILCIKLTIFFIIQAIFNIMMCYYLMIFCTVYHKTQVSIMINYITGIAESLAISLGLALITSLMRYLSIKYKWRSIYYTSKYFFENF